MKKLLWISCLFLLGCKSENDASLNNKWKLDSFVENDSAIPTNVPTDVFYTFNDGKLTFELEANTCIGSYIKGAETISFGQLNCSKVCCDSSYSLKAVELTLDSIETFKVNGSVLKLEGGQTIIQLQLAD